MDEDHLQIVLKDIYRDYAVKPNAANDGSRIVHVLKHLNLTVQEGEFISIVGPSGCGKSTLLNLLAGLAQPSSGEIVIAGKHTDRGSVNCGMVQQGYALFPWLTVQQNVEFGLEIRSIPKKERREISQHYLKMVFMESYANHYPHELSGGMQQRVAIARALAYNPSFLLMDEPFSALDRETRETLQDELLTITSTTHKTIIFVTHDIFEAVVLADRVVVMSSVGTLREVVTVKVPRPRKVAEVRNLPEVCQTTKYINGLIQRRQALPKTMVNEAGFI